MNDEVDFLHSRKHENLLWIATIILIGMLKHFQSSWNGNFAMPTKKSEMELIFWMQINIKVASKLISRLRATKIFTRWYYHYWWAWWSIRKVLKVTSLQIFTIFKKKLGMEFIFIMQINIKVSKLFWDCFCVLLSCKTFRYFMGVQSCLLLLVSGWLWSKMGAAV